MGDILLKKLGTVRGGPRRGLLFNYFSHVSSICLAVFFSGGESGQGGELLTFHIVGEICFQGANLIMEWLAQLNFMEGPFKMHILALN